MQAKHELVEMEPDAKHDAWYWVCICCDASSYNDVELMSTSCMAKLPKQELTRDEFDFVPVRHIPRPYKKRKATRVLREHELPAYLKGGV